ncbi:hypothetical protein ACFWXO_30890 [Kitasatospora sp. NPDC059088]|uniref:hypothetical protein n=1 Tax=Kitasatospora sp. NPDC059088 TaxID=3346722 RepID=UPI00367C1438
MKIRKTAVHPPACGCNNCHRDDGSLPLDQADAPTVARMICGTIRNLTGRDLQVVVTATLGRASGDVTADRIEVRDGDRTWDVTDHLDSALSFDPPF